MLFFSIKQSREEFWPQSIPEHVCVWRRKSTESHQTPSENVAAPQVKGTVAVFHTFLPAGLSCSAGALVPHWPGADGTELSCKATVC